MAALNPRPKSPWFPVYETPPKGLLLFSGVRFLVRNGDTGREIVEVDATAPRAWLASGAVTVNGPREALKHISSEIDQRGRPPVEGLAADLEGDEMVPLSIREIGGSRVEIDIEAGSSGLLVLADAWAPGWRVEVNGEERKLLRVGGDFRGVEIEPVKDRRTVAFIYQPAGWTRGLWIGGFSLIITVLLSISAKQRRWRGNQ